jgi:hypothetical protein
MTTLPDMIWIDLTQHAQGYTANRTEAREGDTSFVPHRLAQAMVAAAAAREAELLAEVERLTNEAVLNNAECDGLGSLLLSVQKDCIAEHKRANKAEAAIVRLRALLDEARKSGQKKHRRAQEKAVIDPTTQNGATREDGAV